VTQLAEQGTQTRPLAPAPQIQPADSATAARATTLLRDLAAFCATSDPVRIAHAPSLDADFLRSTVETINRWLDRFVTSLPSGESAA